MTLPRVTWPVGAGLGQNLYSRFLFLHRFRGRCSQLLLTGSTDLPAPCKGRVPVGPPLLPKYPTNPSAGVLKGSIPSFSEPLQWISFTTFNSTSNQVNNLFRQVIQLPISIFRRHKKVYNEVSVSANPTCQVPQPGNGHCYQYLLILLEISYHYIKMFT